MTETTVNRVAELYKEKSELFNELSTILNTNNSFIIGYNIKFFYNVIETIELNTLSKSFLAEIKKLTEEHIKNRIEEINKELKDL